MAKGMEKGKFETMKKSIGMILANRFGMAMTEIDKVLDKVEDLAILENILDKAF